LNKLDLRAAQNFKHNQELLVPKKAPLRSSESRDDCHHLSILRPNVSIELPLERGDFSALVPGNSMTLVQSFLLGMMVAWTPSLVALALFMRKADSLEDC
jgi:hypothetical protein